MDKYHAARAANADFLAQEAEKQAKEEQARMVAAAALEEAEKAKRHLEEKRAQERFAEEQRNVRDGYRAW